MQPGASERGSLNCHSLIPWLTHEFDQSRLFYGPGMQNWDMALLKATKLAETKYLEFRFEAFNAFNHAQFLDVDGNFHDIRRLAMWSVQMLHAFARRRPNSIFWAKEYWKIHS